MTAVAELDQPRVTSADATFPQRWRRYRIVVAVALFGIVVAIVVGLLGSGGNNGDLDPRSYQPNGTHALAALLDARGVHVDTVTTAAAAQSAAISGTTLVVVNPARLDDSALSALAATHADLVVMEAGPLELGALGLGVVPGGQAFDDETVTPSCSLPAATTAGSISTGNYAYQTPPGGTGCYPLADGSAVVTFARDGRQVTLVGDARPFTNDQLADEGNAALGLGLLSTNPDVVWLAPPVIGPSSGSTGQATLTSLLPDRLKWAVLQLAIAVGVIALWRGRRLGRLVPETLPVVVRQAETVLGRARLYRRARALDRASAALRSGARDRLARRLGFGAGVSSDALTDAVSTRVGRASTNVAALLYGAAPADDHELVLLAQQLAALEREVLRS
jgi:hypothetical protein